MKLTYRDVHLEEMNYYKVSVRVSRFLSGCIENTFLSQFATQDIVSSARSEIMVALSAGQGKNRNDKRRILAGFLNPPLAEKS